MVVRRRVDVPFHVTLRTPCVPVPPTHGMFKLVASHHAWPMAPRCAQRREIMNPLLHPLPTDSSPAVRYELRFQSLSNAGRAYVFPCDADGNVDLDALSDKARMNYLHARTVVGRDFSCPAVVANPAH